jgi:hypothetical protein
MTIRATWLVFYLGRDWARGVGAWLLFVQFRPRRDITMPGEEILARWTFRLAWQVRAYSDDISIRYRDGVHRRLESEEA